MVLCSSYSSYTVYDIHDNDSNKYFTISSTAAGVKLSLIHYLPHRILDPCTTHVLKAKMFGLKLPKSNRVSIIEEQMDTTYTGSLNIGHILGGLMVCDGVCCLCVYGEWCVGGCGCVWCVWDRLVYYDRGLSACESMEVCWCIMTEGVGACGVFGVLWQSVWVGVDRLVSLLSSDFRCVLIEWISVW